ncbi:hypothetical protein [Comamonas sp.]|uniref:hypothetical protein n=1 Tax=Comamonas sp. TaxID=34028 RepID=UPI00289FD0AF|nr:hypothetical protein [Comamonas sp.]
MKKIIFTSIVAIILSIVISTFSNVEMKDSFVNTIYTVSGIMFSIGMGVICSFNPSSVKNREFLKIVRADAKKVRNNYIGFFTLSSLALLLDQLIAPSVFSLQTKFGAVSASLAVFVVSVNIISTIYYILNFLEIQRLVFDITDAANRESK